MKKVISISTCRWCISREVGFSICLCIPDFIVAYTLIMEKYHHHQTKSKTNFPLRILKCQKSFYCATIGLQRWGQRLKRTIRLFLTFCHSLSLFYAGCLILQQNSMKRSNKLHYYVVLINKNGIMMRVVTLQTISHKFDSYLGNLADKWQRTTDF